MKAANVYLMHEEQHYATYNRRTIEGKTVGCSRCVGYCNYNGHPGYLTAELRKRHNCCKKGCNYYVPKPSAEKKPKNIAIPAQSITQTARTATAEYEGMRIVKATTCGQNGCVLSYVTISGCYPIGIITQNLSELLGMDVQMIKLDYDYDVAASIIFQIERLQRV